MSEVELFVAGSSILSAFLWQVNVFNRHGEKNHVEIKGQLFSLPSGDKKTGCTMRSGFFPRGSKYGC